MLTDTLAETLTRMRNAQRAGHKVVRVRSSKMIQAFLNVLKEEGFIDGFEAVEAEGARRKGLAEIEVTLRYLQNGQPAINHSERVSKPGRRIYKRGTELPQVEHGLGLAVVSTSQGILADRVARKRKIGGEILAYIR